jgi:2-polyprenyl-3-methyl-5-hydroxy-6-metoxy-1,4-benzoquinol methylase
MSEIACDLCGADDYTVLYKAGVAQAAQIVECKSCGLMYANPRAAEPDHVLVEDYDADYVEGHTNQERYAKEALQVRDYTGTRKFLAERFPKRGKLLEVGSGFGYLLDFFRQDGWAVLGVEPNEGLNRHARKHLGIDVLSVILPDAKFDDNSFDAVLMMHVIEHVPSPEDTLREIFRVLKPGGMLVMETPRYDTLMYKLLGRRERSLSCTGHIYFFTSKTLRAISEKAGFTVTRADKVGRSLTVGRLAYNLGVISRSPGLRGAMVKTARKLGFENTSMTFNVRDMERIYLTKPA